MAREIDRDDLTVTPDHVIVLKNAGPKGGPGMPEWGMLPIPKKLVQAGVRDMVRISDGRMSGTSYGACILHVAPESFVGGPLGLRARPATRSRSTSRRAASICTWAKRSSTAAARPGSSRRRAIARLRRDVLRPYRPGRRRLRFLLPRRGGGPPPRTHINSPPSLAFTHVTHFYHFDHGAPPPPPLLVRLPLPLPAPAGAGRRGGASCHAAQHGAGARRLSRRGGARHQAHAARPAGLSASALFAAAADRGNLHPRSSEPRTDGSGRRAAACRRTSSSITRSSTRVPRDLHRCVQLHQRGPDHRRAQLCRQALQLRERADRLAPLQQPHPPSGTARPIPPARPGPASTGCIS